MTYQTIKLTIDKGVATLTFNRPDKLNSFTEVMHQELKQAFSDIENNTVRAMILTGAGRGFCAGQDLADLERDKAGNIMLSTTVVDNFNPLVERLRKLPMPVICAVNGIAAGAGANIALACDIVIAAKSASFLQAFAKIGLIPDAGGTWFLPKLVGAARAKGMAMLGEQISAQKALDWGMIWAVCDDDELQATAHDMAERLANGPTKAYALMKQAIQAAADNSLSEQLALEDKMQSEAAASADFKEGVQAFMEKRPAKFCGY